MGLGDKEECRAKQKKTKEKTGTLFYVLRAP